MTTSIPGPQGPLEGVARRRAATGQRTGCANCAQAGEADVRLTLANLSRKYTELGDVMTRYMSEAGLDRDRRAANAQTFAHTIARIIGGVETQQGQYPDCALIGRRYTNGTTSWFCSGVLVHPRVVLTAGHCQTETAGVNVVALDAVKIQSLGSAEIISVRTARVNPLYTQGVIGNDITVLILRRDAQTTPIGIVTSPDLDGATETTLVGFGNSDEYATKGFGTQREVTVDITYARRTPGDDLDQAEADLGFESDREFTAGGGGYDSCNGDSGGPAYILDGGDRKVAGLTSRATEGFTTPCGDGGIYTRVDTQRTFINDVMAKAGIQDQL